MLNDAQQAAIDAMEQFLLESEEKYFLLQGHAGTGKTYCIQHLIPAFKGRLIFTAPTNKATKVLRDTVSSKDYKPECRTIYSLLGLRLEANGEVKELAMPEDPVDLTQYRAVIVDEASMINANLMRYIDQTAKLQKVKFIFMGDAAQLPPVGEARSPVWWINEGATLTQVMRHDNQILTLATALRGVVDHPAPRINLKDDHADGQGVWKLSADAFEAMLVRAAREGHFSEPSKAKAIAWRNVTVDQLNARIRREIFDSTDKPWVADDRVILLEPAKDLNDEVVGTTDDEGRVNSAEEDWHPVWGEFKVWRLSITKDDNQPMVLRVLHRDSEALFARKVEELAAAAKADRRRWKNFWDFKDSFHKLRHAYAITAHRSQGSTYDMVFVDWRDILINRNRQEAFRCLYVACTRPKRALILN